MTLATVVMLQARQSHEGVGFLWRSLSPCLVGIEACPSAHRLEPRTARRSATSVRLMPPSYVKAYRQMPRAKNDANGCALRVSHARHADASHLLDAVCARSRREWQQQTGLHAATEKRDDNHAGAAFFAPMLSNATKSGHMAELGINLGQVGVMVRPNYLQRHCSMPRS